MYPTPLLADSPPRFTPAGAIGTIKTTRGLPTMYDLPSEDPEEPGVPDIFHNLQPQLLRETFRPPNYLPEQILVAADLNLYYDPTQTAWHKRPDWFVVLGVQHLYHGHDLRLSYVTWDERVNPFLVVELLSPGTEEEDLGETSRVSLQKPPTKWEVYEQILKIPYYVVFSRYTNEVQLFKLINSYYQTQPLSSPGYWFEELQLGLGLWSGRYDGAQRSWLRWYDSEDQWIPTPAEAATYHQQQARQAQRQTRQAQRQTRQAQLQTQQIEQQAAQLKQQLLLERQRTEQLAAKLRALGIDPA